MDGIKEKIWMQLDCLNKCYEVIVSPLPEFILKMDVMSDWGTLTLPNILNRRYIKLPLYQY